MAFRPASPAISTPWSTSISDSYSCLPLFFKALIRRELFTLAVDLCGDSSVWILRLRVFSCIVFKGEILRYEYHFGLLGFLMVVLAINLKRKLLVCFFVFLCSNFFEIQWTASIPHSVYHCIKQKKKKKKKKRTKIEKTLFLLPSLFFAFQKFQIAINLILYLLFFLSPVFYFYFFKKNWLPMNIRIYSGFNELPRYISRTIFFSLSSLDLCGFVIRIEISWVLFMSCNSETKTCHIRTLLVKIPVKNPSKFSFFVSRPVEFSWLSFLNLEKNLKQVKT